MEVWSFVFCRMLNLCLLSGCLTIDNTYESDFEDIDSRFDHRQLRNSQAKLGKWVGGGSGGCTGQRS